MFFKKGSIGILKIALASFFIEMNNGIPINSKFDLIGIIKY